MTRVTSSATLPGGNARSKEHGAGVGRMDRAALRGRGLPASAYGPGEMTVIAHHPLGQEAGSTENWTGPPATPPGKADCSGRATKGATQMRRNAGLNRQDHGLRPTSGWGANATDGTGPLSLRARSEHRPPSASGVTWSGQRASRVLFAVGASRSAVEVARSAVSVIETTRRRPSTPSTSDTPNGGRDVLSLGHRAIST